MLGAKGVCLPVTATTRRRDALPGADFVVTTVAVGGRRGWATDVEVLRRYGVFQPVGDTVMPGGVSRAADDPADRHGCRGRSAPLPRRYLLNYSNQVAAVLELQVPPAFLFRQTPGELQKPS